MNTIHLSIDQAHTLVSQALVSHNVLPAIASIVADNLVAAQVDGHIGHGLTRVAAYAKQAKSGKVNGNAIPTLAQIRPAVALVDAQHGFAFPAINLVIESIGGIVEQQGIAMVGIHRSHHCGQLGRHVEAIAEQGMVALMVSNTPKAMAPWGGSQAVFGTNPIAFATPRANQPPLVIDLSLSHVARGKVMAAAKADTAIPEGWALDSHGNPTTDPHQALQGTMLPMGDAKGAALALVVEILASTLIGANPSYAAGSFFTAEGDPPSIGHSIIALAPNYHSHYNQHLEQLLAQITNQARLPGSNRHHQRQHAQQHGLQVAEALYQEIVGLQGG